MWKVKKDAGHVQETIAESNLEYETWMVHDQALVAYITSTLSEEVLAVVDDDLSVLELWNLLVIIYPQVSEARFLQLKKQFQDIKRGTRSVLEYIHEIKNVNDQLATIGHPVSDKDKVQQTLSGLGSDFDVSCTALESRLQANQEIGGHTFLKYSGTVDAIIKMIHYEGLHAFYKGMATKIVQSVFAASVLFMMKEELGMLNFWSNKRVYSSPIHFTKMELQPQANLPDLLLRVAKLALPGFRGWTVGLPLKKILAPPLPIGASILRVICSTIPAIAQVPFALPLLLIIKILERKF
ncbi:Peroxisomal nicotinamide adenine dinucleotide carrier [Nymphaea thermarum]|nr:Peroxisomal nicotinamide adenine dinucleotide carrier [Nymphaea thermarum]